MQLIQRQTLVYQAGSSDKVYEVDLFNTPRSKETEILEQPIFGLSKA